ncbi:MAG: hypothetical protein QF662_01850 [Phycisphaerae bacterium]|nr:hypothetical protein [Phycisphaerae bacterium]
MDYVQFGDVKVSRFILGSNTFSGFSHQSVETDTAMKRYFTTERIKQTIRDAEALGVNTLLARTDHHMMRVLLEYWDQGGKAQWFAQTCPEVGDHQACVTRAASGGAKACHIHGGIMDYVFAQNKLDEIPPVIKMIRDSGMLAGIAAHNPKVIEWAEANLDVDYYMCCHYNPTPRDEKADHVHGAEEYFREEDRETTAQLIQTLSRPVIHYKVLACGRNDPASAFDYTARNMRDGDAVCVGVFPKDKPEMLRKDVELLEAALAACK